MPFGDSLVLPRRAPAAGATPRSFGLGGVHRRINKLGTERREYRPAQYVGHKLAHPIGEERRNNHERSHFGPYTAISFRGGGHAAGRNLDVNRAAGLQPGICPRPARVSGEIVRAVTHHGSRRDSDAGCRLNPPWACLVSNLPVAVGHASLGKPSRGGAINNVLQQMWSGRRS